MLQGHVDAIGTYYELESSGLDLQKTIAEADLEQEENEHGKSFSESEAELSISRNGSVSSSFRKRLGSVTSKSSVAKVLLQICNNNGIEEKKYLLYGLLMFSYLPQIEKEAKSAFAEESRSTGAISLNDYWQYFRAGAGYLSLISFSITFLIAQLLFLGSDYWLTLWTNAEELRYLRSTSFTEINATALSYLEMNEIDSNLTDFSTNESSSMNIFTTEANLLEMNVTKKTFSDWIQNIDTTTGVYVYSIMIAGLFLFTMIRTTHFFLICMASSVKLHNNMFGSIIRAQLVFFDQNPVGKLYRCFAFQKFLFTSYLT